MIAKTKVTLIEFLHFPKRDTLARPEYAPIAGWQKWGTQLNKFAMLFAGVVSTLCKNTHLQKKNQKSAKIIPKIEEALVTQEVSR